MLHDRLKPPVPAKYFAAVMVQGPVRHAEVETRLLQRWGPIEHCSAIYDFSRFSTYYDGEMGGQVWKYFVTFRPLLPPDSLVEVKLFVEELQEAFALTGAGGRRRTVNLDPGYLTGWNVVLSTVKNRAHRIYLGQGTYAEVALLFRAGKFQTLPWTYPDYADPEVLGFFGRVRSDYLGQLKASETT
jgi:hypothetical protein